MKFYTGAPERLPVIGRALIKAHPLMARHRRQFCRVCLDRHIDQLIQRHGGRRAALWHLIRIWFYIRTGRIEEDTSARHPQTHSVPLDTCVDTLILPLIEWINEHVAPTRYSCQGDESGPGFEPGSLYIACDTIDDTDLLADALVTHGVARNQFWTLPGVPALYFHCDARTLMAAVLGSPGSTS